MNNFRRPKPNESPTNRNDRPFRIVGLAAVTMCLLSVGFSMSVISGAESLVVNNMNINFHRRHIENNHYHQQQKYYTTKTFLSTTTATTLYLRHSLSKTLFSSSKDSEFSSACSSNDPTDSEATVAATSSSTSGPDCDSDTSASTFNGSKKEQRKRYDDELEEAFAQQTREKNPLLGVKSIGVDYGLVRTGVAVTIGYNPEGLDVIVTDHPLLRDDEMEGISEEEAEEEEERRLEIQRAKVAEKVVELALCENADRIVVGLPLHKNGTEAPQTALTRKFACDHLATAVLRTLGPGVPIYMCDERYTSKEAAARIRSQTSRNNNNDLYGLLDAESAKIILEQHYDDRLDRFNTRNLGSSAVDTNDSDSEASIKNFDPGYNGELVTISDADLVKKLTLEYSEKRRLEQEQLAIGRNDRDARAKWRKLAMEKDRIRAKEQQEENAAKGIVASKKMKKKKKRKRK